MRKPKAKFTTTVLGILLLLALASLISSNRVAAQTQPWLQVEQMRQMYQRQQWLEWQRQEQMRQIQDRQQWLQWQQQERIRQMYQR